MHTTGILLYDSTNTCDMRVAGPHADLTACDGATRSATTAHYFFLSPPPLAGPSVYLLPTNTHITLPICC